MNNTRLIAWLSVALVLSLAANVVARHFAAETSHDEERTLFADEGARVVKLRIERADRPRPLEFSRTDGEWRMTSPFACPADPMKVTRLLDVLCWSRIRDSLLEREYTKMGRRLENLGLATPTAVVTMTLADGTETSVAFGAVSETGDGIYAMHQPSEVHIVSREVLEPLCGGVDSFRLRALADFDVSSVTAMDIRRGPELLRFARDGEFWNLRAPREGQASAAKIREYLESLASAEAKDFIWPTIEKMDQVTELSSALLAGYGLDAENAVTVTLKLEDGGDVQIVFGHDSAEGTVAALSPLSRSVVGVDAALKAFAQAEISVFSDDRLFPLEAKDVKRLSVAEGSETLLLSLDADGNWLMDAPVSAPADRASVERLVGWLLTLKSTDRAVKGAAVSFGTNAVPVTVNIESVLGRNWSASMRSREILALKPESIRRLTLSGSGIGTVAVGYDADRAAWEIESAEVEGAVDAVAVDTILKSLCPLSAASVVQLRVVGDEMRRFGLENPWRVLAIDRRQGDGARINLLVGDRCEGGRYATLGASEAVFTLPDADVEALVRAPVEAR